MHNAFSFFFSFLFSVSGRSRNGGTNRLEFRAKCEIELNYSGQRCANIRCLDKQNEKTETIGIFSFFLFNFPPHKTQTSTHIFAFFIVETAILVLSF